jgi:spermidine/putrescine transport system substrate-binding protein
MDHRIGRREFLRRSALAGAGVPFASTLLAACASEGLPPTNPAPVYPALPIHSDLVPIASGLPVERGGTLRIFQWKEYLARAVLDGFEYAHRDRKVRVEVESFLHVDEAIARLREPDADFDVFFPTIDVLAGLVDERMLLPLNHGYLPNLENLWPQFRGIDEPFYDRGQRYTLPYTVFSSGIGWRRDLVEPALAPDRSAKPFDLLWNPGYAGRVGLYDDYLEAMSLALLRDGLVEVRAADDADLRSAADALLDAVRTARVRFTAEGAEEGLPSGEFVAHQAWSGDVLTAPRYAEDPAIGTRLGYWSPAGPARIVGCDLTAICARGRNPVLAHAFLDHLLRFDIAMANFSWNGYQPPLLGLRPESVADPEFPWHDAVPTNLAGAILTPEAFETGQMLVGIGPSERARWLVQWNRVVPSV